MKQAHAIALVGLVILMTGFLMPAVWDTGSESYCAGPGTMETGCESSNVERTSTGELNKYKMPAIISGFSISVVGVVMTAAGPDETPSVE